MRRHYSHWLSATKQQLEHQYCTSRCPTCGECMMANLEWILHELRDVADERDRLEDEIEQLEELPCQIGIGWALFVAELERHAHQQCGQLDDEQGRVCKELEAVDWNEAGAQHVTQTSISVPALGIPSDDTPSTTPAATPACPPGLRFGLSTLCFSDNHTMSHIELIRQAYRSSFWPQLNHVLTLSSFQVLISHGLLLPWLLLLVALCFSGATAATW